MIPLSGAKVKPADARRRADISNRLPASWVGTPPKSWTKSTNLPSWKLYVTRGCAQCHGAGSGLGPDLAGITSRFSREDLFIAIALPNRDVSPRYQTTVLETDVGKVYQGVIIYEAVDGIILQTADDTVRVGGAQIAARRVSPLSLMPAGLLDPFAASDLADLYAYLRSLSGGQQKKN